jgi:hypothetical protein
MKIKITDRTELMFAQAVALAQNGMMKSTIHAKGKDLYILNMDDTILIKFGMSQEFPEAVSFFANDYESPELGIENGQVYFITNSGGSERKKTCPKTKIGFTDVEKIWNRFEPDKKHQLRFNKSILELLDDNLSHVELHNQNGLKIVQKNIYSGARVEIEDKRGQTGLLDQKLPAFEPIGIRTADFKALFQFVEDLTLFLQPEKNWLYFNDPYGVLDGILSSCLYDEIGYVAEVK